MNFHPAPTTAREALTLAWELAHPVKEGQIIPVGTWLVERRGDEFAVGKNDYFEATANDWDVKNRRTLDPLPDPEPDWLDAPAVLAAMKGRSGQKVWLPKPNGHWECTCCGVVRHWFNMADVTPLWPKEDAAYSSHYDEPWCTWLGGEPHDINEKW